MTAEQLEHRAGEGRAELVHGELVELTPRGFLQSKIVGRLLFWILSFLEEHPLGTAGTELGLILARNPDLVYAPDVYFLAAGKEPSPNSTRFLEGSVDLAIVLSPDDRPGKVLEKVQAYLAAGTRLVWVVNPGNNTIAVYRAAGDSHVFSGLDEVTGEDVLPGFSFSVEKLFR